MDCRKSRSAVAAALGAPVCRTISPLMRDNSAIHQSSSSRSDRASASSTTVSPWLTCSTPDSPSASVPSKAVCCGTNPVSLSSSRLARRSPTPRPTSPCLMNSTPFKQRPRACQTVSACLAECSSSMATERSATDQSPAQRATRDAASRA